MKELEILPEGWTNPIRFGGVGYCGKANPGISLAIKIQTARGWAGFGGGALSIEDAIAIRDHLDEVIEQANTSPPFENLLV